MKNNKKNYWKSLNQVHDTPEFRRFLEAEFPSEEPSDVSRRQFLGLMGASVALAGLVSCRRPVEKIVPYATPPESRVPGIPVEYNTQMPRGLHALGLTVKTYDGRPIKIEGNPAHPSTHGRSTSFMQSEILNLYDPDRSTTVLENQAQRDWDEFVVAWREQFSRFTENRGQGLAVLSQPFASPTLDRLKQRFLQQFPDAMWATHEPIDEEPQITGIEYAFGRPALPVYNLENAAVILSLDHDFLFADAESLHLADGFAQGRRVQSPQDTMNRLYAVESSLTTTGANADHRLRLPASHVAGFAMALVETLNDMGYFTGVSISGWMNQFDRQWLRAVARDMIDNEGNVAILANPHLPPAVQAAVAALNSALGQNTVRYQELQYANLPRAYSLEELQREIDVGAVSTLIVLDDNPAFSIPEAILFDKIQTIIHVGDRVDETGQFASWHVPKSHFLEAWGDTRAVDGTLGIIQPLIAPLHESKSLAEVLHFLATAKDVRGYDLVRETWGQILNRYRFEDEWQQVLHDGVYPVDPGRPLRLSRRGVESALLENLVDLPAVGFDQLEVVLAPSSHTWDGRYANNGWLLENPDPVTKLTWENAALISPTLAALHNLSNGDHLIITVGGESIELPVWFVPGQADHTITLPVGFGRQAAGTVGNDKGVNVYVLKAATASPILLNAGVEANGKKTPLASTQDHGSMEGRPLVREADLNEYREHPEFAKEMVEHPPLENLWKAHEYDTGHQWAMTIDLNVCIGCGACTVACQSENNIPVVGKDRVFEGREMHWLRIDRYFAGDIKEPEVVFQPVACQHCENAPCEQVCPVAATVHDGEGLNLMVYNRCIGTRYCSNNCPYKVRRFNFFNYYKHVENVEKMAKNPNVTVRSRGVMEKCTFCLQRINEAKAKAKLENRELADGDVVTACQQACPTQAITFGDMRNASSNVAQQRQLDRDYTMLGEYNLRTRNTFAAKLRNPNPELEQNS